MGETIRILMVAAFLVVTYGPSLRAQSTARSSTPSYRHEVRFTPAAEVARASTTDFTPVARPELPSKPAAASASSMLRGQSTEQRYKPQGPGGFSFPNSLGDVGSAVSDGVGNALRDAASAASESLSNAGRGALNQTTPSTRSNTPSTAPNPRRDDSWMRNTPDPSNVGSQLPSTNPRNSRLQAPSGFGSAGFGGSVATVAGTQDPNSREAQLMEEQRRRSLARNTASAGNASPAGNAAAARAAALGRNDTNKSLAESANFGRPPAGMSLPARERETSAPTGSFGSQFGRTNSPATAPATTPQTSRQPFGPQTADEAGFDFARYNQTQQRRELQTRASQQGTDPLRSRTGTQFSGTQQAGSAQSSLGFPQQPGYSSATLQGWTPKQLEELAGIFGIQPDDKRLADPSFLNELYDKYPARLATFFGYSETDPRLAQKAFVDILYKNYVEQRDATRLNAQSPRTQAPRTSLADQSRSPGTGFGTNAGLRNDYSQSPFGQQQQGQDLRLQTPLNQRQPSLQGNLQAPQFAARGVNQFGLPDNRLASRDANGILQQPSPSALSQGMAAQGMAQTSAAANPMRQTNSRRDVDPRLSEEDIARLPPGAWGFDKYGNFINQVREIVDRWGDPVPESEVWALTVGRKQRSQGQQVGVAIDGGRWSNGLPGNAMTGGNLNRPVNPVQQGQVDPRLAMAGVIPGQPTSSVNAGRPSLQEPNSSSDGTGAVRPPIDQAGIVGVVKTKERSHPLVNLSLFCSFFANLFLFYWIHRLWHKLRGFIASSRVNAANAIAAD